MSDRKLTEMTPTEVLNWMKEQGCDLSTPCQSVEEAAAFYEKHAAIFSRLADEFEEPADLSAS